MGNQTVVEHPLTSIVGKKKYYGGLVTDIIQNIFICVWQREETYTGLEQHDGE